MHHKEEKLRISQDDDVEYSLALQLEVQGAKDHHPKQ